MSEITTSQAEAIIRFATATSEVIQEYGELLIDMAGKIDALRESSDALRSHLAELERRIGPGGWSVKA